jgi:hypothetical protein
VAVADPLPLLPDPDLAAKVDQAPTSIDVKPTPEEEAESETYAAKGAQPAERYNGGLVQHRPHAHLIFWGSDWDSVSGMRQSVVSTFQWLNNSALMGVFSQYFDDHGPIGREVDLSSYTDRSVSHPAAVTRQTIQ